MRKKITVSSDPYTYRLQHIYAVAKGLLEDNAPIPREELKKYFDIERTYETKNDILRGLLSSLQNKNMLSKRKEKELAKLTNRNKEIDKLFERLYEDNVSGKVNDERYYRMSANYETEQGENHKRIKMLRDELQKENGQKYAADSFISIVRKYTRPTELTQLMLSELIEKIEVFHAEKIDGVTVQKLNIHYHCVGEIEIPEVAEAPAFATSVHTRQGVDVVYYPKTA